MTDHIATLEKLHNHASDRRYLSADELAAIHAAIALMRGQSWQPIETAPKDGVILGVSDDGIVRLISWHWHSDYQCWAYLGLGGWFKHRPVHWCELPAPPKDPADEQ